MERPSIDRIVDSVRSAFNATINLDKNILRERHMTVDKSQGLFARRVNYGSPYIDGRMVSIRQAGNERSDNWDVTVSYKEPDFKERVTIKGIIDIQKNDKALEVLSDVLNKFFFRKEGVVFNIHRIGLDVEKNERVYREIGLGVGTKEKVYRNNISGFVESKKEGERLVEMFRNVQKDKNIENPNMFCFVDGGDPARLDCNKQEPNWIKVKVGACDEHKENLRKLWDLVAENDGIITEDIIRLEQKDITIDNDKDDEDIENK